MTFTSFTGLLNTISSLGLAVFVLLKRPRHRTNQAYLFFGFTVALYSIGYFLWGLAQSESDALFAFKILTTGIILINSAYLEFVFSLLGERREKRIILWTCHAVNLFFVYAVFSLLLFETVARKNVWGYWPVVENLFYVYFVLWLGQFLYGLFHLYRGYKNTTGQRSTQIKYVFTSTLIGYFGGATNWLPWFDITLFPPHLNILVTTYVAILAYAVVRHRLMDIEVIIRKTLIFAGIVGAVTCAVAFPISVVQFFVGGIAGISPFWLMVSGIAITVLIYRPLERWLVNLTDKFLFQKKQDYKKLLKDASSGISRIKSLDYLLRLVVHFITIRMRVKNAAVLVYDKKNRYFIFAHPRGYPKTSGWLKTGHVFPERNLLFEYLAKKKKPLLVDETSKEVPSAKPQMEELNAVCLIPSFLNEQLQGVLVLGEKKSDELYTEEDLAVLYTIAQESAIAMENARLYDEAIEYGKKLERINLELRSTQSQLIVAERKATMVGFAKAIGHEVNNALVAIDSSAVFQKRDDVPELRHLYEGSLKEKLPMGLQRKYEKMLDVLEKRAAKSLTGSKKIRTVIETLANILKESKEGFQEVNFRMLWQDSLNEIDPSAYEGNLSPCSIDIVIPKNLALKGNQDQLQRVFVNLIKNAYESMAGKAEAWIRVRAFYETNPEYEGMVRIEIQDNGPGIPQNVIPHIFEQGFSTKPKPKGGDLGAAGQGQGLYVCKHIVESVHGGTIQVKSAPGEGATFILRLPAVGTDDE